MSRELLRVVVSCRVGAPVAPLFDPTLPTPPEPFVPVVSTPVKVITVMLDVTFCDKVAFTETLVRVVEANARQISDVPNWAFVRPTNVQLSPPPVTPVTVIPELFASVAINARRSSFADFVEKVALVTLVAELFWSLTAVASMTIPEETDPTVKFTVTVAGEPCTPAAETVICPV
jgi:hypothetical protein